MGTGDENRWRRIQIGVKDTERLIEQKDYNGSMMKARQTLEFMVKLLAERDNIPTNGDLKNTIDALYQKRRISRSTCENYHKIRMIGNKAAHEGNKSSHSANQAYRLLSQEMYELADAYQYAGGRKGTQRNAPRSSARNRNSARRKPGKKKRSRFTPFDGLKLLIPVLGAIFLILVIRFIKPDSDKKESISSGTSTESVPASSDFASSPTASSDTAENGGETVNEPESSTESSGGVYKASTELNVRPQPNTEQGRIGMLDRGTVVEYVRKYDDQWAVIMYNGREAYVASEYLIKE